MERAERAARATTAEWQQRLGAQIRELRLRRGESQQRIADLAGIDRTTLVRIEAGSGGSIASLVGIARALGREEWLAAFAPAAAAVSPMGLLRQHRADPAPGRRRARRAPRSP